MIRFSIFPVLVFIFAQSRNVRTQETSAPTIFFVELNETVPGDYKGLPLVGKCCHGGQVLVKSDDDPAFCRASESRDLDPFLPEFNKFNSTGLWAPGERQEKFVAIIGHRCRHKRYILQPEDYPGDVHYLLMNGSLVIFTQDRWPSLLSPGIDYCMEIVPKQGLRTLVCFPEASTESSRDVRLLLYGIGLLISVPFLILTILAYSITPKLRDVHGKALCNYCVCLAIAFISLAMAQLASSYFNTEICISIAFIIQFSFVACFFWLNVMCIETWFLVRRQLEGELNFRRDSQKLFFYYSLWGWGPPATLILVSMIMDFSPMIPMSYVKPNFGQNSCWFKSNEGAMPYFYFPVGLLVLANLTLFILTAIRMAKYQRQLDLQFLARNRASDRKEQRVFRRLKRMFYMVLGLFFLMGLNWSVEVLSWWAGGDFIAWSAFDLVNALQGIVIFCVFVLRAPIRDLVWYQVQKMRGVDVNEPDIARMDLYLLPLSNGDAIS